MKSCTGWQEGDLDLPGPRAAEVFQPPGTIHHQVLGHLCLSSDSLWVMATKMLLFLDTNKVNSRGNEKFITLLLSLPTFYLDIIISQVQLKKETFIKLCGAEVFLFNQ